MDDDLLELNDVVFFLAVWGVITAAMVAGMGFWWLYVHDG